MFSFLREAQTHIEKITNKLPVLQGQTDREEQGIAKAVAEQDANKARQQREKREKKAKTLESIAEHRELMVRQVQMLHDTMLPSPALAAGIFA